jgi:hypothetical protein
MFASWSPLCINSRCSTILSKPCEHREVFKVALYSEVVYSEYVKLFMNPHWSWGLHPPPPLNNLYARKLRPESPKSDVSVCTISLKQFYYVLAVNDEGGLFSNGLHLYYSFRQKYFILDTFTVKESIFRNTNNSFNLFTSAPYRAPQKRHFLGACSGYRALSSQYFSEATSVKLVYILNHNFYLWGLSIR